MEVVSCYGPPPLSLEYQSKGAEECCLPSIVLPDDDVESRLELNGSVGKAAKPSRS